MGTQIDIEELKEEKDPVRREMLLQKYGVIPVKLTQREKDIIMVEANPVYIMGPYSEWGNVRKMELNYE